MTFPSLGGNLPDPWIDGALVNAAAMKTNTTDKLNALADALLPMAVAASAEARLALPMAVADSADAVLARPKAKLFVPDARLIRPMLVLERPVARAS